MGQVMGMRAHTHTHTYTHTYTHTHTQDAKNSTCGNALTHTITAHLCRVVFYCEQRKWAVIHSTCAVSTFQVSLSACLSVPFIHMDDQTCLCSSYTKPSLFVWFSQSFYSLHLLPLLLLPPPLYLHALAKLGFSFFIVCLLVRWHATHCGVKPPQGNTNGGEPWVSEKWRERPWQHREMETGWDKMGKWRSEIIIRRNIMKESEQDVENKKVWKSKLKKGRGSSGPLTQIKIETLKGKGHMEEFKMERGRLLK